MLLLPYFRRVAAAAAANKLTMKSSRRFIVFAFYRPVDFELILLSILLQVA